MLDRERLSDGTEGCPRFQAAAAPTDKKGALAGPSAKRARFCGTLAPPVPSTLWKFGPRSGRAGGALSRKSLLLSVRNAYEALAISVPTVIDGVRGRLSQRECDARLETFAAHVMRNAEIAVSVRGRENLGGPQSSRGGADAGARTYVVMSNHQSHYDVPVLYYVLGGRMRMVAKKELFALPVFGRALRDSGMIEVDRGNRQRAIASLGEAKKQLESGTQIWIAPEGTRSTTGELLPFKKGGFVLALDINAPILPITIKGTRDVLPSHGMFSRRGVEVFVTIHPPIETSAFAPRSSSASDTKAARDALMNEVRLAIASAL